MDDAEGNKESGWCSESDDEEGGNGDRAKDATGEREQGSSEEHIEEYGGKDIYEHAEGCEGKDEAGWCSESDGEEGDNGGQVQDGVEGGNGDRAKDATGEREQGGGEEHVEEYGGKDLYEYAEGCEGKEVAGWCSESTGEEGDNGGHVQDAVGDREQVSYEGHVEEARVHMYLVSLSVFYVMLFYWETFILV